MKERPEPNSMSVCDYCPDSAKYFFEKHRCGWVDIVVCCQKCFNKRKSVMKMAKYEVVEIDDES
jgi:hypothetical protein